MLSKLSSLIQSGKKSMEGLSTLSKIHKTVKKYTSVVAFSVSSLLAGCSTTQNNQEVDFVEKNQYSQNGQEKVKKNQVDTKTIVSALESGELKSVTETNSTFEINENTQVIEDIENSSEAKKIEYKEFHIVEEGQRMYSIAKLYDINVFKLIELNRPFLDNPDLIPTGFTLRLGNLVPLTNTDAADKKENIESSLILQNGIDTPKIKTETVTDDTISFQDIVSHQNNDFNEENNSDSTDRQSNIEKRPEDKQPTQNLENNVNIVAQRLKTYDVNEGDSLYIISKKTGISLGKLMKYNDFLAKRVLDSGFQEYILYPTFSIFLEQPDLDSKYVQSIISQYNNYHVQISHDSKQIRAYKKSLELARQKPNEVEEKIDDEKVEDNRESLNNDSDTYIVKYGDTLGEIAQNFGFSLYDLGKENNIQKSDYGNLQVGQKLKLPEVNKNLLSYKQKLVLTQQEKKEKFYSEVKSAIKHNPYAFQKILEFLQDNISDNNTIEIIKNQTSQVFLIGLLYSLEEEKRNRFVRSIKHPDTNSQDIVARLTGRKKYKKCGKALRSILETRYDGLNIQDYGMHGYLVPGILDDLQDFVRVDFDYIDELKPEAILTYQAGYGINERFENGHTSMYTGKNISAKDDGQSVKYYEAHVYSSKYGDFYPYLGGSLNHSREETGLNGFAYYHKSTFDPSYKSTNMSKQEYAEFINKREKKSDLFAQELSEQSVGEICRVEESVEKIIPSFNFGKINKYVTAYLQTKMGEDENQYVLRHLEKQGGAKACLTKILEKYENISKLQLASKLPENSEKVITNNKKISATKCLLASCGQNEVGSTQSAVLSPK